MEAVRLPNMPFASKPSCTKEKGSLGVEHASDEALREALRKVVTPVSQQDEDESEKISRQVLASYGLIAGEQARAKRENSEMFYESVIRMPNSWKNVLPCFGLLKQNWLKQ